MGDLRFNINFFCFIFLFVALSKGIPSAAQQLTVITKEKQYKELVDNDSLQKMVELREIMPSITYDLRYATKNNFTGKKLYKHGDKTFIRLAAANALKAVSFELQKLGLQLKVWDAYRPYSITKRMWDLIGDDRYVANPAKGSNHNRGLAVDLTIIDSAGNELDMGTGYDNFSDTAHHSFKDLSPQILANRQLLKTTMEKHGFVALETEWWHFTWPNNRNYAVLDLPFKKLGK